MRTTFDQTTINGMTLQNRLVRSATWEGMCDTDGKPTEKLVAFYRDLALGGVGLIISGYTFVRPEGKQLPDKISSPISRFVDLLKSIPAVIRCKVH